MNSSCRLLYSLFVAAALLIASGVSAAEPPERALQNMVNLLQQKGDPAVLLDYVDWSKAFENTPQWQKDEFNLQSAKDLKAFSERALTTPEEILRLTMKDAPPEDAEEAVNAARASFREQSRQLQEQILKSTFKIGTAALKDPKNATVSLTTSYEGKETVTEVPLTLVDGKWLLPALSGFPDFTPADQLQQREVTQP